MATKAKASTESLEPERLEDRQIPSDDCLVAGKAIHRGQSVWVSGVRTRQEKRAAWALNRLAVLLDEADPDPVEDPGPDATKEEREKAEAERLHREALAAAEKFAILERHDDQMVAMIAARLVDWDWTDHQGKPRQKPDGTTGPLDTLAEEEIQWLIAALRGETPKNA